MELNDACSLCLFIQLLSYVHCFCSLTEMAMRHFEKKDQLFFNVYQEFIRGEKSCER